MLGVLISSNGKFNDHISKTVMKVNRMIGMVKRSFKKTRNPETLTSIYKRYILPILSYASPIWSPSYKTKIQELESTEEVCWTCKLYQQFLNYLMKQSNM
jgi:hypothetical protein